MSSPKEVMEHTLNAVDRTFKINGVKYVGIQFTFTVSISDRIAFTMHNQGTAREGKMYLGLVDSAKGIFYLSFEIKKLNGYDFWVSDTHRESKEIQFAIFKVPENYQGDLWFQKYKNQVLTYNFNARLNVRFCAKYLKIFHVEDQRIITEPLILPDGVTHNLPDDSVIPTSEIEKSELEREYADNLQAFKSAVGDDVVISIASTVANPSIANTASKSGFTPGFDSNRTAATVALSSVAVSTSTSALASAATGKNQAKKVTLAK